MQGPKIDTKLFLWLLLFGQILLIGLILSRGGSSSHQDSCRNGAECSHEFPVQFIQKEEVSYRSQKGIAEGRLKILGDVSSVIQFKPIGSPFDAFLALSAPNGSKVWCFQEGTEALPKEEREKGAAQQRCKCKSGWHGVDCGQPELVWRSLFAAKTKATVTTKRRARNIYFIIRTTGHSLETLAIQLLELSSVVDVFVVCAPNVQRKESLRESIEGLPELKTHLERLFLTEEQNCRLEPIVQELSNSLGWRIEDDDLVLISDTDEIPNRRAIDYLKWYDDGHDVFRFRMKHLMYGFYWQHPSRTVIGSLVVKYKTLLDHHFHDERLMRLENALILGDLNHIGGWRCQLCYHPLEIISFLNDEFKANSTIGARHKNGVMDEEFVTKLIANGVNIYELLAREGNFEKATVVGGGPMDLVKVYPSREKYYSPQSVQAEGRRRQFENTIRNPYSHWELDVMDDYSYYN